MKPLAALLAAFVLLAASPEDVVPGLEASGYFIEEGSGATESVVSDAVFEGRADGGRLYLVVLGTEPPGGATTFSDSVLDRLTGGGYVVTVAPETVGFAADGSSWTSDEMNDAVDASLDGASDDEVIRLFITTLTSPAGAPAGPGSSGGGISLVWVLVIGAAVVAIWAFMSKRTRERRTGERLEAIKAMAREKLDEVANDIIEMELEVSTSGDAEVKEHYQRASAMYQEAMGDTANAATIGEMMQVSEELDLAIWELDSAEALLDGKPKPPRPEPARHVPTPGPDPVAVPTPPQGESFERRPQRHSSGSDEMLSMLLAMLAMGGGRGGGFGGGFGGGRGTWTGQGGGAPRPPMGGGGGRIRGGGRRRG